MAVVQHASYDDWRRVYGDVYEALPERPDAACPNCGHRALRLEFVARGTDRIGYAMFWCDFCRFGIRISRTWVPTGVTFHAMDIPPEELRKIVPEYTTVYPPPDTDPEDFEEVTF
ncbi:MAG TPA: hypothetical protein VFV67_02780 [Actinophytocola sp.]|uniref:hypothetical protein n=1 Tax=Actinophytocola sp. TaxID=1872138 RepID=UPI002DBC783C|nr:hypothetical protein [Actinophytocola sp.]HEU5469552.1 hypothetical protein [Actinophytocola sp.]